MRRFVFLCFLLPVTLWCQTAHDVLSSVDVFTGTSNSRWMQYPGAAVPLGLVKFSPDNQGNVWDGGYEYTVGSIAGFSFLHSFSLSSFTIMPVRGKLENEPGQWKLFAGTADGPFGQMWTSGYRSRIDKRTEKGRPGYYAATLVDAKTRVEVTATERTGWMRYAAAVGEQTHLLFDFANATEEQSQVEEINVRELNDHTLTGSVRQTNQYAGEFTVYFTTEFSVPIHDLNSWENGPAPDPSLNYGGEWRRHREVEENVHELHTKHTGGVWVDLDGRPGAAVVVRTGVSLVGEEQSAGNLKAEATPFGFDFDAVAKAAADRWRAILGRVQVTGGSEEDRTEFYTSLYRSYAGKAIVDDSDGSYRDACGSIARVPGHGQHVYSSDGLWGTQWTQGPLWTLLTPELMTSFNRAMLLDAQTGGWLPQAFVNNRYSPVMDAQHEIALLVGAWQKDVRGFDGEQAYAAIRKVLTSGGVPYTCGGSFPQGRAGNRHEAEYMRLGYVPDEEGPASSTFEYAYDDSCAAVFAAALNKQEDADMFRRRSDNWRNAMSPEGWATRRNTDGSLKNPEDLHHFGTTGAWTGGGFLEGNAWIYTWFVPQDVTGLMNQIGPQRFNERLTEGFEKHFVDLTNEPNLQAPWLFNYSGYPSLAQRYARDAFARVFDADPLNGWPGEEDEGQMGSYVALIAMGLFDMEGGCAREPEYQITSPIFDSIDLKIRGGTFRIVAHGNSAQNRYIQSARLNGVTLKRLALKHAALERGGTLDLFLGFTPNDQAFQPSVSDIH